jgi:hypothetical protein
MLNNVALSLRRANRNVTLRHPNAIPCQLYRRQVTRTDGLAAGTMGGAPTLGGLGMLDSDDEPEVEYTLLGDAKVLMLGMMQPGGMSDARDTTEDEFETTREASIEPITESAFEPKDADLVCVFPGGGIVVTYEVTKILATVHIPPYLAKVQMQAQGDLPFDPEIAAQLAARPDA